MVVRFELFRYASLNWERKIFKHRLNKCLPPLFYTRLLDFYFVCTCSRTLKVEDFRAMVQSETCPMIPADKRSCLQKLQKPPYNCKITKLFNPHWKSNTQKRRIILLLIIDKCTCTPTLVLPWKDHWRKKPQQVQEPR